MSSTGTKRSRNRGTVKPSQAGPTCKKSKSCSTPCTKKISKYFAKSTKSNDELENSDELSDSPYKECLNKAKIVQLDISSDLDDFKTPKAINKVSKISNAKPAPKNVKKKRTKQPSLRKFVEDNLRHTDVNPEHLQMALALSESTYAEENPNETLSSQEKRNSFKKALEKFGFGYSKSKIPGEVKRESSEKKINKKSRYRFVTPILKLRSQEERDVLISSKISLILAQNSRKPVENIYENYELFCESLENQRREGIFKLNCSELKELNRKDAFYVQGLEIERDLIQCGCLLKDWYKIPGREATPERENPIQNNIVSPHNDLSLFEKNTPGELSPEETDLSFGEFHEKKIEQRSEENLSEFSNNMTIEYFNDFSKSSSFNENGNSDFCHLVGHEKFSTEVTTNQSPTNELKDTILIEDEEEIDNGGITETRDTILIMNGGITETSYLTQPKDNLNKIEMYSKEITEVEIKSPKQSLHTSDLFSMDFGEEEKTYLQEEMVVSNVENIIESPKSPSKYRLSPKINGGGITETRDTILIINGGGITETNDFTQSKGDSLNQIEMCSKEIIDVEIKSPKHPTDLISRNFVKKGEEKTHFQEAVSDLEKIIDSPKSGSKYRLSPEIIPPISLKRNLNTDDFFKTPPHSKFFGEVNDSKNSISPSRERKRPHDCISPDLFDDDESLVSPTINRSNLRKSLECYDLTQSDCEEEKGPEISLDQQSNLNITDYVQDLLKNYKEAPSVQKKEKISTSEDDSQNSPSTTFISDDELNYSSVFSVPQSKNLECKTLDSDEELGVHCIELPLSERLKMKSKSPEKDNQVSSDDSLQELPLNPISIEDNFSYKTPDKKFQPKPFLEDSFSPNTTPSTSTSDSLVIKTKNITPIANYDAMNTPKIIEELDKFGLKPLKRQKGAKLLKYIYESTHPLIGDENQTAKKRRTSCLHFGDIVGEVGDEADIILERKQSKRVASCPVPLHIVWHNFIMSNPKIRQNILLYEPLQLEVLHSMLKDQGFKFNVQDLLGFLDKKCITIRTVQGQHNRGKKPR